MAVRRTAARIVCGSIWGPRRHAATTPIIRTRRQFIDYREGVRKRGELG